MPDPNMNRMVQHILNIFLSVRKILGKASTDEPEQVATHESLSI